jgi:hypothetical protein
MVPSEVLSFSMPWSAMNMEPADMARTTVNTAASLVLMVSLMMQTFLLMLLMACFCRPVSRKFAPDRG